MSLRMPIRMAPSVCASTGAQVNAIRMAVSTTMRRIWVLPWSRFFVGLLVEKNVVIDNIFRQGRIRRSARINGGKTEQTTGRPQARRTARPGGGRSGIGDKPDGPA